MAPRKPKTTTKPKAKAGQKPGTTVRFVDPESPALILPSSMKDAESLEIEDDWATWLYALFPAFINKPMSSFHEEFWTWAWAIQQGQRPVPRIGIWPRDTGKSTHAELFCAALGARNICQYAIYVQESQDRADDHVANIATMLESRQFAQWYPNMANRALTRYGKAKGWRRNRLHTASGFVVDALGLDVASRGLKVDEKRPDLCVFDDLDSDLDATETTDRKVSTLTRRILPALRPHAAILGIQNLVHSDSIFSRLVNGTAGFLSDAHVSGPIPALIDMTYETQVNQEGRPRIIITGGTPTWEHMDRAACQDKMDTVGLTAFLSEMQHHTPDKTGGMYDHVSFRHCTLDELPLLDKVVCWVDPAVTDTKESDAMGIQIDGLGRDGLLYRLWSWEKRGSPLEALRLAIKQAEHYGAVYVGIETDQGGDTWGSVFREARDSMGSEYHHLTMRSAKAGQGYGSKVHRQSQQLADYERGLIVHVEGTHHVLESALIRFPNSPMDLCLVAETAILTSDGEIPIAEIEPGMQVQTSLGLRDVILAGCTGRDLPTVKVQFADGTVVQGTSEHPVWTLSHGWVGLGHLRRGMLAVAWQSSRHTVDFDTDATPIRRDEIIGSTSLQRHVPGQAICIDMSTKITSGLSLQDMTSITSMEIPSTIVHPIWSHLPAPSIDVLKGLHGQTQKRSAPIWNGYENWPVSGMGRRRGESGTDNMVLECGRGNRSDGSDVLSAKKPSGLDTQEEFASAQPDAEMFTARNMQRLWLNLPASNAESPSRIPSTEHGSYVVRVVERVTTAEQADVFNLQVADAHHFFANGILVHNCDASFWSWRDLRRLSRPAKAISATGTHGKSPAMPAQLRRGATLGVPGSSEAHPSMAGRSRLTIVRST